ncbi:metal-dependent hydrolase [Methanobacterium oryzae]|uniref:metal-dependent hydrolase n=1 Tax=Methanobacterium oryzae TaxID=69540 RepID=UPI003D1B9533
MDVITHFLVPYIILAAIGSKNKLAGAFGGISLDFDTIFVAPLDNIFVALTGILAPQLFILAHRGITHSFIFALITSTIFLYILSRKQVNEFISTIIRRDISVKFTKTTIAIAYFGALIHLFLDFLTTKGIPLVYPFSITRYAAEIYPAINIIITIVAVIVLFVLYLRVNESYKKIAMTVFMIILVSFGCIMAYEKSKTLEAEATALNGNYSHIATYPTQNMFVWDIVEHDAENTSYKVSEYNTLNNQKSNIKIYKTPLIEKGSYSSAQIAIKAANGRPDVQKFKFNSYYVLVDAKYNSGKWNITYYDILSSWTERSLTVSIPSK